MEIKQLPNSSKIGETKKLQSAYERLSQLLDELRKQDLPDYIIQEVNERTGLIIPERDEPKMLRKSLKKQHSNIIKLLEKELKMVPKNYYRNLWIALGMTTFGVPIGLALGAALGNMAFLGIGFPIGMVIGIAIGSEKDNKAQAEGRQLDIEYEL